MEKRAAIVIHVYKESLIPEEEMSLRQLNHIMGGYPVIITAPQYFDASAYRAILKNQVHRVIEYPACYFNGISGYNKLMLSKPYYQALLEYEYILLHHTDAYVFRDELAYWMDKSYDYIGAPVYAYDGTMNPTRYICVGQGGFSLRKVKTFYELADSGQIIYKWADIKENFLLYNWKGKVARLPYYLGLFTTRQARLNSLRSGVKENEDVIWGHYVPKYIPSFSVAPFDEAYQFSMEYNCDTLLALNKGKLPFGCHGWYKDLFRSFWLPFIGRYEIK